MGNLANGEQGERRKQARAPHPDSRFPFALWINAPHGRGSARGQPCHWLCHGDVSTDPLPELLSRWWFPSSFRLSSKVSLQNFADPSPHPNYLSQEDFSLELTSVCSCLVSLFVGSPLVPGICLR